MVGDGVDRAEVVGQQIARLGGPLPRRQLPVDDDGDARHRRLVRDLPRCAAHRLIGTARDVVRRRRAGLIAVDAFEAGAVGAVGDLDGAQALLDLHRHAERRPRHRAPGTRHHGAVEVVAVARRLDAGDGLHRARTGAAAGVRHGEAAAVRVGAYVRLRRDVAERVVGDGDGAGDARCRRVGAHHAVEIIVGEDLLHVGARVGAPRQVTERVERVRLDVSAGYPPAVWLSIPRPTPNASCEKKRSLGLSGTTT